MKTKILNLLLPLFVSVPLIFFAQEKVKSIRITQKDLPKSFENFLSNCS